MQNTIKLMEKKLNKYFNNDIKNITKKDADAFFLEIGKNATYSTAKGYISQLNHIFKNKDIKIQLSLADYDLQGRTGTKGICTKEEVELAIENLINPIDRFIILAIYNGISGNRFVELLNLNKSDINFSKSTITVGDKVVKMDGLFKKITMDALEQKEYAYFTSDGEIKYYELNTKSKYVVKSKPLKRNNNGLEPMGVEGFKTRFKNIVASAGLETTTGTLEKSGYVNKMHSIKKDWKVDETKELVKTEKMNVDAYNLLRLYKNFYEI